MWYLLLVASVILAPSSKCSVPGSFEDETLLICIIYIQEKVHQSIPNADTGLPWCTWCWNSSLVYSFNIKLQVSGSSWWGGVVWYYLCSYTHICKCTTRCRNYMYIKSGTGYGRLASTSALLLSALLYFRESPDRTWLYSLIIETLNQYCMNHCVFYSSHGDFGSKLCQLLKLDYCDGDSGLAKNSNIFNVE